MSQNRRRAGGKPFPSLHKALLEQASAAFAGEHRQQPWDGGAAEGPWQTLALTQAQAGHAQPRLPEVPRRQRPVRKAAREPQDAISCIRPPVSRGPQCQSPSPSLVPISIPIPILIPDRGQSHSEGPPATDYRKPFLAGHTATRRRHGQHRRSNSASRTQNNCRARQGN